MFLEINYEDIINNKINNTYTLVDIRSPREFESETIPGAINIPLFNNDERELIGTTYKNVGIEEAKILGVEFGSKNFPNIYKRILELDKNFHSIVFFCARGGLRSTVLISLLKPLGINAIKLSGGYKSYRKYVLENLPTLVDKVNFVVLYGNTGTGKTDILKHLEENNIDILDLEGCANHRGSLLGGVGLGRQSSQKMFESLLFHSLLNRKSDTIFTEGESRRIGRIFIPDYLFEKMQAGKFLKIRADLDFRIKSLLKEYVHDTDEEIIKSFERLRKYLGNARVDGYLSLLGGHQYEVIVADLLTNYYDPMYEHRNRVYEETFENNDPLETALDIIEWKKRTEGQ